MKRREYINPLSSSHQISSISYSSAEMQSVYPTALAEWAIGHSLSAGGGYSSAEMQSVYSVAPAN